MLLHGLASQRRFWNLVVPHLVGVPILALDQRGHGDSERPDGPYDASTCARDLATAMDALGWSRAVVLGHSWGGSVAATFAAEHPSRTLALIALDGGFSSLTFDDAEQRAAIRTALEPPRWAASPDELVAMISSRPPGDVWTDELASAVLPIFEVGPDGLARARLPFDTHMAIVDALLDYDAAAVLRQVQCPAWLVSCEPTGELDNWAKSKTTALTELAGLVRTPRLFRWGGAVHDVPLQWPALVAGLLRAAVDDAASAAPPDSVDGRSEA